MGKLNLADVQGNIVRGYRMAKVRHLLVRVVDAAAARRCIGETLPGGAADVPRLTTAEHWDDKPTTCLNVGISAAGLRALGASESTVTSFPQEFQEGPAARATKVGDIGDSAPQHWQQGLDQPDGVHLMWSIHAGSPGDPQAGALLDEVTTRLASAWSASGAFREVGRFDGTAFDDDRVHFGYRDSITQPRFRISAQLPGKPGEHAVFAAEPEIIGRDNLQPITQLGAVFLGHKTPFPDVRWEMPEPRCLGYNGSFNAFRVMQQDVDGFEEFLAETVAKHGQDRPFVTEEWVAAKLMGRWRNGTPISLSPTSDVFPAAEILDATDATDATAQRELDLDKFDYVDHDWGEMKGGVDDFDGIRCPWGAHIRRNNPRGDRIVQRSANATRKLVRRGMPYGPPYDPQHPRDGIPRGLLGNFLCGSLIAQFESIMYDWTNLGLQDPRITGTNDPVIGANDKRTSRFVIPLEGKPPIVLTGFPRFVTTIGSAYLFCPSITGLTFLSRLAS